MRNKKKSELISFTITSTMVFYFAIGISFLAFSIYSLSGLTLIYNDAMSHLNLSRLVLDNMEPGLSQIGGVWLPMTHILPLIFVWHDSLWQSGFAGSIFSMISYILTSVAIFKIIQLLTKNSYASFLGSLAFMLNVNMLYLQSTALTEPTYLLFFTWSVYFFVNWLITKKELYLILLGFMGFFQVLTRYDGWFVVLLESILIGFVSLYLFRESIKVIISKLILFYFPVGFGILLWLLWGFLIFENPLFFAFGEYSARAQQDTIESSAGSLITKGSIYYSAKAYWFVMLHNIGYLPFILSLYGLGLFLLSKSKVFVPQIKYAVIIFLLAPVIFNILALFLGFSILNIPELEWNPSGDPSGQWFNVRYGIFALPFAAVYIGLLASFRHIAAVCVTFVLLIHSLFFSAENINIIDGTKGSSAYVYEDISWTLSQQVDESDTVLLSTSKFNPIAFKSNVRLSQIIHEGVSETWSDALKNPENYADWIVMAQGDIGEPVYTALIRKYESKFLEHYELFYRGVHADIYKRRTDVIAIQ